MPNHDETPEDCAQRVAWLKAGIENGLYHVPGEDIAYVMPEPPFTMAPAGGDIGQYLREFQEQAFVDLPACVSRRSTPMHQSAASLAAHRSEGEQPAPDAAPDHEDSGQSFRNLGHSNALGPGDTQRSREAHPTAIMLFIPFACGVIACLSVLVWALIAYIRARG